MLILSAVVLAILIPIVSMVAITALYEDFWM